GVIQDFVGPDRARVAFTDESIRELPTSDLMLLESTPIPPLQMIAWLVPSLATYLAGTSPTSEPSSPVWITLALSWDAVLALAVVAIYLVRLSPREWLYPLCITAGTVL